MSEVNQSLDQLDNESQKEYVRRLHDLLAAERLSPKSDDPFGPIDYLGSILYMHDAMNRGAASIRWGLLTNEVRDKFRERARETVASWAVEELMVNTQKAVDDDERT